MWCWCFCPLLRNTFSYWNAPKCRIFSNFFHKFFGGDTVAAAEPSSIPADAFWFPPLFLTFRHHCAWLTLSFFTWLCCYRWSGIVCVVIGHYREPCNSSWTDWDVIWHVDLWAKGTTYCMVAWIPHWKGHFWGRHPGTCLAVSILKVTHKWQHMAMLPSHYHYCGHLSSSLLLHCLT